jgi:hypothetical protein
MPDEINSPGILFWRRPTLAQPIAVLPSGLQRFTAVFGMGTGGATALLSPEKRVESVKAPWEPRSFTELMVESHQSRRSAFFSSDSRLGFQKNNQLSANYYQLLPPVL